MSNSSVIPVSPASLRFRAAANVRGSHVPYAVEVHDRLAPIADEWRQLEGAGAATVFQRFEVFEAWTRTVAPGQADWRVVCVRQRPCGRVVLLLPLSLRQMGGLKVIEGADLEVSDFLSPVVAKDFRPSKAQMRAVWAEVLRLLPPADAIRLAKMPALIGNVSNPMLLLKGVAPFHLSNFRTRLATTGYHWTERIPEKVKTEIAARRRKLGKRGKLQFRVADTEVEAERYFEAMVEQRAERCRAMERGNILDDQRYRAFYRGLLRPERGDSLGVMQALLVDEEIVATGYGLNAGTSFLMIFPTFVSKKWRNYSPGLQLFMESMGWAGERGMTWYDFTIGGEGFKRDLAAEAEPLYEYLSARSLKGWPGITRARMRSRLRQSPALRTLMRRVRSFRA